ncbi:MFS transporter [Nonomuraea sp. H19]|uniref:MFS transporter n=1 Tax=Nonomuraea sp. H19 TaxID=3452206 RepID=UPI003F89DB83
MPVMSTIAPARAGWRQWTGLAVLTLPTVLLALDVTVLFLALPHLSADLQPSGAQTLWIMDIYGFMIAGFLVTMGTLGDRIGRRKLLLIGATAFGAASALAAFATSAEMLIAARALLGIAGATLMPSTLALISNMFQDERQRGSAIAVWMSSFSGGIAAGPLVGGLLLESFRWGSVFLIGVPVMVLLLVAGPLLLPEYRDASAGRLDLASVALSLAAILPIVYGVKEGFGVVPILAIAIGAGFGVLFVRRQVRLANPLLDLRLFSSPGFGVALGVLLLGTVALGGVYMFITQYLQSVQALSALESGLWLLPAALASVVASLVAPAMTSRYGPRTVVTVALVIAALGYAALTQVNAVSGLGVLVAGFILVYISIGPILAVGTDLVVGSAPPEKAGSAASMSETSAELGVGLGVALLGSLGEAFYRSQMAGAWTAGSAADSIAGAIEAAEQLPAHAGAALLDHARDAYTDGLNLVSGVAAVVMAALAIFTVVKLRKNHHTEEVRPASRVGGA